MSFPYFPYSSNFPPLPLLSSIFFLPFSQSKSSTGLLIVGGGGAWNSAEFWPTRSCQPPNLPRALDTPSLGLIGDQVGHFNWQYFSEERWQHKAELWLFDQILLLLRITFSGHSISGYLFLCHIFSNQIAKWSTFSNITNISLNRS